MMLALTRSDRKLRRGFDAKPEMWHVTDIESLLDLPPCRVPGCE